MLAEAHGSKGHTDQALDFYSAAESNAIKALENASPAMQPFLMNKIARVQIGLGRPQNALQWASQAETKFSGLDPAQQAGLAADFYLGLGRIYYGAGQQSTGIAYMDQAIAMATSPERRSQYEQMKHNVTGGNS